MKGFISVKNDDGYIIRINVNYIVMYRKHSNNDKRTVMEIHGFKYSITVDEPLEIIETKISKAMN